MYEIDNEKFGQFLAGLRREKGLTQRELAQSLYVSDKAVSKWVRGLSLPDIALLQPLAETLGVTATELLSGQSIPPDQPLSVEDVEPLLGAALELTAEERSQRRASRRRWGRRFLLALLAFGLEVFLTQDALPLFDDGTVMLWLPPAFAVGFGVYFLFFAREKLPPFYDQYRINFYSHGAMRMNVPGVYFNNRNWPHILRALRVWCCAATALWAPAFTLLWVALARLQATPLAVHVVTLLAGLAATLGGLFLPVYVVGRKYE